MVEYSRQRGNSKRRSKRGHREPVPWLLLCQKWGEAPQGLILDGRISNTDEAFYFIFDVLMNCEFECVGKKNFSFFLYIS